MFFVSDEGISILPSTPKHDEAATFPQTSVVLRNPARSHCCAQTPSCTAWTEGLKPPSQNKDPGLEVCIPALAFQQLVEQATIR